MNPSTRLAELGLELPPAAAPVGAYVPARRGGPFILTSGQLPVVGGHLSATGKVPSEVNIDQAREAARAAVLNALAAAAEVAGGLDAIRGIIRAGVFVNSAAGFTEQPQVANGASELLVEIFGETGRHARAAVGVNELPLNACVEVELLVTTE